MNSISFGGFDQSFTSVLQGEFSVSGFKVSEPGNADIHIHLNPYLNKLPTLPECTVAVIAEPIIVRPDLYVRRNIEKYLDCITISSERAKSLGLQTVIELPVSPPTKLTNDDLRNRRICLVAGHKFSASKCSNYGLRREVLKSEFGSQIDLYGPDWFDPVWLQIRRRLFVARLQVSHPRSFSLRECLGDLVSVFPNYKGMMGADFNLMSRYQLSLVIENQSDYVSEKLWISIARGAVPIYIGPSLKSRSIELVNSTFQVESNLDNIRDVIENASEEEIAYKRNLGYEFLLSDWIAERNPIKVANSFVRYIQDIYA